MNADQARVWDNARGEWVSLDEAIQPEVEAEKDQQDPEPTPLFGKEMRRRLVMALDQRIANHIKAAQSSEAFASAVAKSASVSKKEAIEAAYEAVSDQIEDAVSDQIEDAVSDQIGDAIENSYAFDGMVNDAVSDQLHDVVQAAVSEQLQDMVQDAVSEQLQDMAEQLQDMAQDAVKNVLRDAFA